MIKYIFFLMRISLIPFLLREIMQRRNTTIVLYHEPSPETARKHLQILKSKYNIISLRDFVKAKQANSVRSLPPKALIITIDDGHRSNYELLSVFEELGVPITIFLCAGIVGTRRGFWFKHELEPVVVQKLKIVTDKERFMALSRYNYNERNEYEERQALSSNEISEMSRVVDFQSHTMFHPILTRCSMDKIYEELEKSKSNLEYNYGLQIYAISYPNGNYSDSVVAAAQSVGYECGVTLDPGYNNYHADLFRLKRFCINDNADSNELLVRTCGLWDFIRGHYLRILRMSFKSRRMRKGIACCMADNRDGDMVSKWNQY